MEKKVSLGHRVIMSSTSSSCEIYALNILPLHTGI